MQSVLIVGGTGYYGRHIVGSLVKRGVSVRVMTRNKSRAREILGPAPELVTGDIRNEVDTREALTGIDSVVISVSAFTPRLIRQMKAIEHDAVLQLFDLMKTAGIRRVVYISVYDIREEILSQVNAQFRTMALDRLTIENTLRPSEFNWTILGAPPNMDIFKAMLRKDKMIVPGGGPPALPTIATCDAGEIAAQAALRDDLCELRLHLTGPEALSFQRAVRIIGSVYGKDIKYVKIPLLQIKIASLLAWPFNPYLRYLSGSVSMLNLFPQDLAKQAPDDFARLQELFDYKATTLEMEAEKWKNNS